MNQNKKIAEKNQDHTSKECIDKVDSLKEGRFLIALATGLGKTWIFSHFKRYGRVLILSHRMNWSTSRDGISTVVLA